MKIFKQFMLLLMVCSLVTLAACSSDDDGDGGGSAPSGTLTAKVDGTNYQSMEIASSAIVSNAGGGAQNLIIIAANSDGKSFAMTVFGYEGTGTYEFTGANIAVTNTASYTETDVSDPMNPTSEIWQAPFDNTSVGSVTITEETNDKVKGTFSFMGKNVNGDNSIKDITDGAFDLNKQ